MAAKVNVALWKGGRPGQDWYSDFWRAQAAGDPPLPRGTEEDLLVTAASAELRSEHPLGKTIVAAAKQQELHLTEAEDFRYTPAAASTHSSRVSAS